MVSIFWWPEVILTITIGLVVCGIATPAVLNSRESQRKIVCQQRLSRLATGLAAHESAYGTLPPGVLWGRFQYDAPRTTYYANLLEVLGESTLLPVPGVTWCSPENEPVTSMARPDLLCPSDRRGGAVKNNLKCGDHAMTNYMACFGRTMADVAPKRGPFFANSGLDLNDSERGRTSLLLMAEYITGTPTDLRGGLWGDEAGMSLIFTSLPPNSPEPDRLYPNPRLCDPENTMHNNVNENMPCAHGDGYLTDTAAARSHHAGGVHALFADGHIQFVSSRIDPLLWQNSGVTNPEGDVSSTYPVDDSRQSAHALMNPSTRRSTGE